MPALPIEVALLLNLSLGLLWCVPRDTPERFRDTLEGRHCHTQEGER